MRVAASANAQIYIIRFICYFTKLTTKSAQTIKAEIKTIPNSMYTKSLKIVLLNDFLLIQHRKSVLLCDFVFNFTSSCSAPSFAEVHSVAFAHAL